MEGSWRSERRWIQDHILGRGRASKGSRNNNRLPHISSYVIGHWPVSDRILVIKLRGQHFNISIIQVYAPTSQSSESDIDNFYDDLDKAKDHCKSQEIIIIMGDLNAKVGEGRFDNVVGEYGLGQRNERGERFIEWSKANNQIISNTWFKNHPRR